MYFALQTATYALSGRKDLTVVGQSSTCIGLVQLKWTGGLGCHYFQNQFEMWTGQTKVRDAMAKRSQQCS